MVKGIYSIKDLKADYFNMPFESVDDTSALRQFINMCKNEESNLNKFSSEFALFRIALFDNKTGKFTQDSPPDKLMEGEVAKEM